MKTNRQMKYIETVRETNRETDRETDSERYSKRDKKDSCIKSAYTTAVLCFFFDNKNSKIKIIFFLKKMFAELSLTR